MIKERRDPAFPAGTDGFYTMENNALRDDLYGAVIRGDRMACLLRVGEFHGHICPGIALGIMATLAGLKEMGILHAVNNGMEDMLAIVETNACFSDGVQYLSGCTLGNNALIYRDFGKMAVTFALRSRPHGVRVRVSPEFSKIIEEGAPTFFSLMDKVIRRRNGSREDEADFMRAGRLAAVSLLRESPERFLATSFIEPDLPPYAPIADTATCSVCGEPFMSVKGVLREDGVTVCRGCAGQGHLQVEGLGIVGSGLP